MCLKIVKLPVVTLSCTKVCRLFLVWKRDFLRNFQKRDISKSRQKVNHKRDFSMYQKRDILLYVTLANVARHIRICSKHNYTRTTIIDIDHFLAIRWSQGIFSQECLSLLSRLQQLRLSFSYYAINRLSNRLHIFWD